MASTIVRTQRLHAELNIAVDPRMSVAQAHAVATEVRHQLLHHLDYLSLVVIHVDPADQSGEAHHRIEEHAHDGLAVHSHGKGSVARVAAPFRDAVLGFWLRRTARPCGERRQSAWACLVFARELATDPVIG